VKTTQRSLDFIISWCNINALSSLHFGLSHTVASSGLCFE